MEKIEKIKIEIGMEIQDSNFIYFQNTDKTQKKIFYDYKRCIGCGICVNLCPKKALELGPIPEIATGLDAPPIIMDQEKCSFCGICAGFCPVKAIKMEIDGKNIMEFEEYPHLDSNIRIAEKCLPCVLCEKVCKEDAIKLEFTFPKKEDIIQFKEGVEGEIKIAQDKCNFCGVCAYFCSAILMIEKEPTPQDIMPYDNILVDEEKCDYCKICEELCPEDAIKVKREKEELNRIKIPKITGKITINDNCTRCGWCKAICPYDAVELKKPFEGDISLIKRNLKKCDPIGCHGCFNICPGKAWYIPKEKEKIIGVKDNFCTFCGACVKACPYDIIEVERTYARHTSIKETPWAMEWKDAIKSLTDGKRSLPDLSKASWTKKVNEVDHKEFHEEEELDIPVVDEKKLNAVREKIKSIAPLLDNIKVRYVWERKPEKAVHEIIKKMQVSDSVA
ncbi:MAG: 4Fe-4S binding protein [Methanosarcinales archaeon]